MSTDNLEIYKTAVFIRAFEQEIAKQFDAGQVPGLVHLCSGAEVAEVTLASVLDNGCDQLTGSHRSHGLALAMGASPLGVACEILGRDGGLSNGLAGTQHILAPENGFLTSNGIVGAQVPLAAGAALSAKTRGTGGIAVAVFGDGAANQGAVLETMNLAVSLSLPLMFVLENNGFGQSTTSTYAGGNVSYADRARAFGLNASVADGHNAENCCTVFAAAVAACRKNMPVFVEVSVPRLSGHYHGENTRYIGDTTSNDPLDIMAVSLEQAGVAASTLSEVLSAEQLKAARVVANACAAPPASAANIHTWHRNLEAVHGR